MQNKKKLQKCLLLKELKKASAQRTKIRLLVEELKVILLKKKSFSQGT